MASDATKQIQAAAQSKKWRWPSDMHKYIDCKASMKDVGVLMLALFQTIMKDRKSFAPLIASCAFSNAVSIILIYVVGAMYFGPTAGFLLSLFFASSFWTYQVILSCGYQITALPFFLLTVLCADHAGRAGGMAALVLAGLSGVSFALMMFSSASSRKWLPLIFAAFLYGHRSLLSPPESLQAVFSAMTASPALMLMLAIGVIAVLLWILAAIFSAQIVRAIYDGTAPGFISDDFMQARSETPMSVYMARRLRFIKVFFVFSLAVLALPIFSLLLSTKPNFHAEVLSFVMGFFVVVAVLTAPRFLTNIRHYFNYWIIAQVSPHFPFYQ
ncbi:MAG: hypothetical protein RIB59_01065, partial [Rhodospirillales bacterium]